ncbi:hypothetical protein MHU86_17764 [Fragilaria crotonensis]|nr:hypothetical protein MHU86_17764 [Fragilaria crotonensis]
MPNQVSGLSCRVFTKSRWQQHKFHDLHVWGCPVYVLDKSIADGKKLPRWKPRSTRCVNMGLSSKHASTVPIVLNPSTGYITPQFHIVFDDWFSTITSSLESLPDFNSAHGHNSSANPTSSTHSTTRTKQKCRSMMIQHPTPSLPTHFATWTPLRLQWIRHLHRLHFLFRRHNSVSNYAISPDSSTPPRPISSTRETVHQQHDVVDNSIVAPTSTPVATVDSIVRAPTIPITPNTSVLRPRNSSRTDSFAYASASTISVSDPDVSNEGDNIDE